MRYIPEPVSNLSFVRKQDAEGQKSISAFRKSLAQDLVNQIHAEQNRTAEMAEKELIRLLKLFR